jgi:hypothetical protein
MLSASKQSDSEVCRPLIAEFETPTARDWNYLRQDVRPEWRFLAGDWAAAWAETYLPYDRWRPPLRYLTVRRKDGIPTGVLPLVELKFGPWKFDAAAGYFLPYRSLPLAGSSEMMDATCESMVDALATHRKFRLGLRIGPTSTQDRMCGALIAALRRAGWQIGIAVAGEVFVVELPNGIDEFNELSSAMVKRVDYYERRLQKLAKLKIVEYAGSDHRNWETVLSEAAQIERNSWIKREGGTIMFDGVLNRRFWMRLLSDEFLAPCMSIWVMYIDRRPASFSCGINVGATKYVVANLYDEAFKAHSCGAILARQVLVSAICRGQKLVDWGQGDSGYKQKWNAKPGYRLRDIVALPPGAQYGIIKAALKLRAKYVFS